MLPDWIDDAACRNSDNPTLFFDHHTADQAKAICRRCPVREDCFEEAMSMDPWVDNGVRGGLTLDERRNLRRRTGPSRQHGTTATYKAGCRCGLCREATTEYKRSRRAKAAS